MSLDGNEDAIVGALKQSLAQNDAFAEVFNLEDYKAARAKGYKQISAGIAKCQEIGDNNEGLKFYVTLQDDILSKLMATSRSYEDLFKKELGKCYSICQEVARNVEAHEQLLRQIQVALELGKYYAICQEVARNVEAQEQLLRQIQDATITNLKQQCMTHNIQCRDMKFWQRLAGLHGLFHRLLTQRAVPGVSTHPEPHGQQEGGPPAPY